MRPQLFFAIIVSLFATGIFETIHHFYGPTVFFYSVAITLVIGFFVVSFYKIRRITRDMKEREDRWKHRTTGH